MSRRSSPSPDELAWIDGATLPELKERFPAAWERVGQELVAAAETGRPEALVAFARKAAQGAAPWVTRVRRSGGNRQVISSALPHLATARMARLALDQTLTAAAARSANATPAPSGTLRFSLGSGWLVQRLFFRSGLQRKPVSPVAYRLLWPMIRQRRLLMPLVQPRGIYCFYGRPLVQGLVRLIGGRRCVELAAGDGTLARFLNDAGAAVQATDDASWAHAITYPEEVERLDARTALAQHQPQVVLCSFPPPGNTFEAQIFRTPSVQTYVVLTSRHRHAAGDWNAYEAPGPFTRTDDQALARWLLPPEIDPAVLVFQRLPEGRLNDPVTPAPSPPGAARRSG